MNNQSYGTIPVGDAIELLQQRLQQPVLYTQIQYFAWPECFSGITYTIECVKPPWSDLCALYCTGQFMGIDNFRSRMFFEASQGGGYASSR